MDREPIIAIVGFLGSGKTTLLKKVLDSCEKEQKNPFVVLNDYENAQLDAERLNQGLKSSCVKPLSGSCVVVLVFINCDFVNEIPSREEGITLIEANGTTDACSLMGFWEWALRAISSSDTGCGC